MNAPSSAPIRTGSTVDVEIERIVPGGLGMAHAGGLTVFVGLAAPGDRARVRIDRLRGRTAFGSIVELLRPGPARVEPPCPFYGRCGGCNIQHLSYEAQLVAKAEIIQDALRRIARVEPPTELPIVPSPSPWAYRARAAWHYDPATGAFGYLERASAVVCDIDRCLVLRPELQAALSELRARVLAGAARAAPGEYRAAVGDDGVALLEPDGTTRREELTVTVAGERLRFDVECFFQANHGILPALVAEVVRCADVAPPLSHHVGGGRYEQRRVALDLYAGVGLFTLPLARRFDRVFAVDAHRRAAEFARKNAAAAGLANVRVAAVPVARWLAERGRAVGAVSCVVVDPPRTGIDPEALTGLRQLRPPTIVYVSCDPATFARDIQFLLVDGYRLTSIVGFDMFPQTHHVEIVASLARPA